MSKDKGTKNHKKSPADKSSGKKKAQSAYQAENKSAQNKDHTLDAFAPPPADFKSSGSRKA